MPDVDLVALYKNILDRVLQGEIELPSMPDIAMSLRRELQGDSATCESITDILMKDPALTAYLIKAASSPVYRREVPPNTLPAVVGLLGFSATSSLVMLHSTRNMVKLECDISRALFEKTWQRLVFKTSIASFLSQNIKNSPVLEEVQMAMLLTEVGSLAVLSSMLDAKEAINVRSYFLMCRQYSKKIGDAALEYWEIDPNIIKMHRKVGQWGETWGDNVSLLDIANLSLYYTVMLTEKKVQLPKLETLSAYNKLPEELRVCDKSNWLNLIAEGTEEIQEIANSFK